MEIAAYPVPYNIPGVPLTTEVKPARAIDSGLPSRQGRTSTPEERVLQGEVLNNKRRRNTAGNSDSARSIFEQQARRNRPDLSGLDASSRQAIESYLDNDELNGVLTASRHLIDEYV